MAKDATAHIEGDIDYDIFVSVYKNKMVEQGFEGEISDYLRILEKNTSISQDVYTQIEQIKHLCTGFDLKCSDLFYLIDQEISPLPLDELINQKQINRFVIKPNEQTNNLIKF